MRAGAGDQTRSCWPDDNNKPPNHSGTQPVSHFDSPVSATHLTRHLSAPLCALTPSHLAYQCQTQTILRLSLERIAFRLMQVPQTAIDAHLMLSPPTLSEWHVACIIKRPLARALLATNWLTLVVPRTLSHRATVRSLTCMQTLL